MLTIEPPDYMDISDTANDKDEIQRQQDDIIRKNWEKKDAEIEKQKPEGPSLADKLYGISMPDVVLS